MRANITHWSFIFLFKLIWYLSCIELEFFLRQITRLTVLYVAQKIVNFQVASELHVKMQGEGLKNLKLGFGK